MSLHAKKRLAIFAPGGIGMGIFSQGVPAIATLVSRLAERFDLTFYPGIHRRRIRAGRIPVTARPRPFFAARVYPRALASDDEPVPARPPRCEVRRGVLVPGLRAESARSCCSPHRRGSLRSSPPITWCATPSRRVDTAFLAPFLAGCSTAACTRWRSASTSRASEPSLRGDRTCRFVVSGGGNHGSTYPEPWPGVVCPRLTREAQRLGAASGSFSIPKP
jgi:hypothetical protein